MKMKQTFVASYSMITRLTGTGIAIHSINTGACRSTGAAQALIKVLMKYKMQD